MYKTEEYSKHASIKYCLKYVNLCEQSDTQLSKVWKFTLRQHARDVFVDCFVVWGTRSRLRKHLKVCNDGHHLYFIKLNMYTKFNCTKCLKSTKFSVIFQTAEQYQFPGFCHKQCNPKSPIKFQHTLQNVVKLELALVIKSRPLYNDFFLRQQ